jgi:hypothetical protein
LDIRFREYGHCGWPRLISLRHGLVMTRHFPV